MVFEDSYMLYFAEKINKPKRFRELQKYIDVVCAGASLTGWNNTLESPDNWPFPTYPKFLHELTQEKREILDIVNAGMAGTTSKEGIYHIKKCLKLFPNSRYFIIGYGGNDLAFGAVEEKSQEITENLDIMVDLILEKDKKVIIINTPNVNPLKFPAPEEGEKENLKRNYHNPRLLKYFSKKGINIADIWSKLKPEHYEDTLHTNETGSRIIAKQVHDKLSEQI